MGARSGGGAGLGGGRNVYRSSFNNIYNSALTEIGNVISDVTSKAKYYKSAAEYLKSEVLGDIDSKSLSQAKQIIKENKFAFISPSEYRIIQKGARTKAALKMKSKIEKVLKNI